MVRTIEVNGKEIPYYLDLNAVERIEEEMDDSVFNIVSSLREKKNMKVSLLKTLFYHAVKSGMEEKKELKVKNFNKDQAGKIIQDYGLINFTMNVLPELMNSLVPQKDLGKLKEKAKNNSEFQKQVKEMMKGDQKK